MTVEKDPLIVDSLNIPQIKDIYDLSRATRLSIPLLVSLSKNSHMFYKEKKIEKKHRGEYRTIYIPSYSLRIVQKWILKKILDKVMPSQRAMAFRKGKEYGIKANAQYHIESLYGISIDLKDFFPSISSAKVYYIFNNMGYNSLVATILTNFCTYDEELPQGAVCSPALSNLVCRNLDRRLIGLCEKRGVRYTRYADDMYFSCDNKDLLHKIFPVVKKIIQDEGYEINERKTHFNTPSNRKQITGIVVNDKDNNLKASKKMKQEVRVLIHKSIVTGDYSEKGKIIGKISFINYIESNDDNKYLKNMKKYISKCGKQIVWSQELVDAFNSNQYYKDIKNMEYSPINWNDMSEEEYNNKFLFYTERKKYLMELNVEDICSYKNWPYYFFSDVEDEEAEEDNNEEYKEEMPYDFY